MADDALRRAPATRSGCSSNTPALWEGVQETESGYRHIEGGLHGVDIIQRVIVCVMIISFSCHFTILCTIVFARRPRTKPRGEESACEAELISGGEAIIRTKAVTDPQGV